MFRTLMCMAVSLFLFTGISFAANGTPDQAKAMMEKAAAFYAANGQDAAFAEYSKQDGPFINGDLYIVVLSQDGTVLAHGRNKALVGKNMMNVPDVDGKLFTKEMIELGNSQGSGSVDYKFTNPETKKVAQKVSFFKKVKDVIILCGAYK